MIKSPYGLTLGVLALLALGYLGNLAVQLAADHSRHANSSTLTDSRLAKKHPGDLMSESGGQTSSNTSQTRKDVAKIRTEMVLIRNELANLNARINNAEFENQTMASRLDRFESSLGPFTASINQRDIKENNSPALAQRQSAQGQEMRMQENTRQATASRENSQPPVTSRVGTPRQDRVQSAEAGQSTQLIQTGSLPEKDWIDRDLDRLLARTETQSAVAKPSIDVKIKPLPESGFETSALDLPPIQVASRTNTTQTRFGIHLYSGPNITDLRQTWKVLRARYAQELGPLESRFVQDEVGNGKPFQLIAGPFDNVLDAVRVCAKIEAGLIRCEQTLFTGRPL